MIPIVGYIAWSIGLQTYQHSLEIKKFGLDFFYVRILQKFQQELFVPPQVTFTCLKYQ